MFSWLRAKGGTDAQTVEILKREALKNAVELASVEDPTVAAKIAAKELLQKLLAAMRTERGVHIESLLTALAAMAGYSCQMSLRAQALARGLPETASFTLVTTTNGEEYYFGDPLNNALAGAGYSIYGLAAGAAQEAGAQLPDLDNIFAYVAGTLGSDAFGIPRTPKDHQAADLPINYIKNLWPVLHPDVQASCPNPLAWPLVYGLALQQAVAMSTKTLDPTLTISIIMECAVPMSKVRVESA